jgi:hypothetical protein
VLVPFIAATALPARRLLRTGDAHVLGHGLDEVGRRRHRLLAADGGNRRYGGKRGNDRQRGEEDPPREASVRLRRRQRRKGGCDRPPCPCEHVVGRGRRRQRPQE